MRLIDADEVTNTHGLARGSSQPPGLDNIGERLCNLTDSVVDEDFFL